MLSGKLVSLTRHSCRLASRGNHFRDIAGITSPAAAAAASPTATSAAAAAGANLALTMTYSTSSRRRKAKEDFDEMKIDIEEAQRVAAIREKAVKTYQEKAKNTRLSWNLVEWCVLTMCAFIFIDYFGLDFWDRMDREKKA